MRYKHNSLLKKILYNNITTMSIFIVFITVLITIFICHYTKNQIIAENTQYLEQYAEQTKKELNSAIIQTTNITKSTYISSILNKKNLSRVETIEFFDYSRDYLTSAEQSNNSLKIYTSNENIFETIHFSGIKNMTNYDDIINQFESENNNLIFQPEITYDEFNYPTINIYSRMLCKSETILHYQVKLPIPKNKNYPITIYHKKQAPVINSLYINRDLSNGFMCLIRIDSDKIIKSYFYIISTAFIVLIFLILAVIALSKSISSKMYSEVNKLISTINEKDLIENKDIFRNSYELYELNIIKKALQDLALKIKDYSDSLNELELELFAKQLDPHMLYNSLTSIRLNAFKDGNERVINLVDNMALYYREILKKDRGFITLAEEIETIKKYIFINQLSHEKNYELKLSIQENLYALKIPPQFLHTFVENSLVHGLCGIRKNCVIKISAKEDAGKIMLEIYDNGYGITEENLALLNSDSDAGKGIGIQNSIKRLKLAFGNDSTIRFESEKNKYTRVIIQANMNT